VRAARLPLLAVLLACCGLAAGAPQPAAAAILPSGVTVQTEGRAPVRDGRFDTAYQQALDEAFRRGLLEALRQIAPDRQSPHDLETWSETILSRAADFVGAWRILAEEQRDGFLTLTAEVEVYRDKLARAARAGGGAAPAAPVRVLVLTDSLTLVDRTAEVAFDAGRTAAGGIEAELARRGATIVTSTDPLPWENAAGPSSEENREALAAAAGRKLAADAVLILQLSRRGQTLLLDAQLIAAGADTTLVSSHAEIPLQGERPLAEAFAVAARQVANACAPRLPAARSAQGRGALPRSR
jgi:hypothetical protein